MRSDPTTIKFKEGDLIGVRSYGFVGSAIRWRTRSRGEERTEVNHWGVITSSGPWNRARITEAVWPGVIEHTMSRAFPPTRRCDFCVIRPVNLTKGQTNALVDRVLDFVGLKYGWFKIVLHLLGMERLISGSSRSIICNLVAVEGYGVPAIRQTFGLEHPLASDPDDIGDYLRKADRSEFLWIKDLHLLTNGGSK